MGHKAEGSATRKRYIHRRPEYLRGVVDGIEALFRALSEYVEGPFKRLEWIDQPSGLLRAKCVPTQDTHLCNTLNLERETRLELATPTLARPEDPL